jgi:hypothetical protein
MSLIEEALYEKKKEEELLKLTEEDVKRVIEENIEEIKHHFIDKKNKNVTYNEYTVQVSIESEAGSRYYLTYRDYNQPFIVVSSPMSEKKYMLNDENIENVTKEALKHLIKLAL